MPYLSAAETTPYHFFRPITIIDNSLASLLAALITIQLDDQNNPLCASMDTVKIFEYHQLS